MGLDALNMINNPRKKASNRSKERLVYDDLPSAFYASLLHVIPIVVSFGLVILNFKGYYIGGELSGPQGQDSLKLLGLQIAAKMMELSTVASLSCMLFTIIRNLLLQGGLPFGAITAGFEFSKLPYLWSKEFVATCGSSFTSVRMKVFSIITIIAFALLSVGIGPAAAVASQPVIQEWPAGGTLFYMNTAWNEIYPSVINGTIELEQELCTNIYNDSCSTRNYNLIAEELLSHWPTNEDVAKVMPENTLISGLHSLRNLAIRFVGPFTYNPPLSVATVPMSNVADALARIANYWTLANHSKCYTKTGGYCYYNDLTFSVETLQPVTYTSCLSSTGGPQLRFPNLNATIPNSGPVVLENIYENPKPWFNSSQENSTLAGLQWVELPQFSGSSVGVITTLANTNASSQTLTCTIDARWANATITGSFKAGPRVISGFPREWFTDGRHKLTTNRELAWPQILISPTWAQHLNPIVNYQNITAFELLTTRIGKGDGITKVPATAQAVEAILAVMVAEGLSRLSESAMIQGSLKSTKDAELLPAGAYGNGGSAFDYVPLSTDDFVRFRMLVTANGYGYGISTATVLACALLLVYACIAVTFVVVSVFRRGTSQEWDTISEVVLLGMGSRRRGELRGGNDRFEVLRERVRVREDEEGFELVFVDGGVTNSQERRNHMRNDSAEKKG